MSLEKLVTHYNITPQQQIAEDSSETAIVFGFDSGYLEPFKVMVYSMVKQGTMLTSPVIIISDDPAVFEDDVVKQCVDRCVLVDGELQATLYDMAANNVKRAERTRWNRGTFLKWAVFQELGVKQAMFLDVDMICLQPIESMLTLHLEADMVGCAQFQLEMVRDKSKKRLSEEEIVAGLNRMIAGIPYRYFLNRLNSGVMVIRERLLSDTFRNEMISFAKTREDVNEQSHITNFFRQENDYRLKIVGSDYNFHEGYLGYIGAELHAKFIEKIKILHYPGSGKPWKLGRAECTRKSLQLWWEMYDATKAHGLLAA